jgi:hypothetical protein
MGDRTSRLYRIDPNMQSVATTQGLCKYEKILNFLVQLMLKKLRMLNYSLFSYLQDNHLNKE